METARQDKRQHNMISNEEYKKRIGVAICNARLKKGMTQEDLGRVIGVGKQDIWKIEHGKNDIPSYKLFVLAEYLNQQ